MKRLCLFCTIAGFTFIQFLESCHSSRRAAAASRPPKYYKNVAVTNRKKPVAHPVTTTVPSPSFKGGNPAYRPLPPNVIRKKYAGIMGLNPTQIRNVPLYQFIDRWYGVAYRLGGKDGYGIDCSGFAQKLYGDVYKRDLVRTAMEQFTSCRRFTKTTEAREGDLVFFSIQSSRITHVGVYLANNFFVHASTSGGVMISSLNEDYWHRFFAGCGRLPQG